MSSAADAADNFTNEAFTLLALGVIFVILREVSRIAAVGIRGLWADDYIMILVVIVYALETATAYAVGAWWHGLANNGLSDQQRIELDIARNYSDEASKEWSMRQNGSKTQLVGWSLYTLLLWLLKLCICIFYARITQSLQYMKQRINLGYLIIISTYIATVLAVLLGCHPFSRNWQIQPDPGNHCQPAISHIDLYVTVILNVASDIYLLSIPLPLLWKAELPWTKKLSLISLFSGGLFVMAAGCLRCALIIKDPVGGAQQAGSWAVRETFVAVIVANLPLVYQGYRKFIHPKLNLLFNNISLKHSRHHDAGNGSKVALDSFHEENVVVVPLTPTLSARSQSCKTTTAVGQRDTEEATNTDFV